MKAGRRPPGDPESYPHLRPLEAGIPVVSSHVTQNPRYSIAQNHGQTAPTTVAHHHAHSINRLRFCLHDRTWLLIPCLSLIRSWYYLEYMSVDMFRDAPTHSSSDTRLRPGTIERHTAGEFTTNPIMSSIFLRTSDTCDRPNPSDLAAPCGFQIDVYPSGARCFHGGSHALSWRARDGVRV